MKSASYEYRKMSARSGAQFVPIGMPTVCWKTFPAKTTKILSTRNSSILMMSSSEYLFLESECSFTKYVSSCPSTKYLYLRLPFLKMNVSYLLSNWLKIHKMCCIRQINKHYFHILPYFIEISIFVFWGVLDGKDAQYWWKLTLYNFEHSNNSYWMH